MLSAMQLCRVCHRPIGPDGNDDAGASFGRGTLCLGCGFYRLPPGVVYVAPTKTAKLTKVKAKRAAE